MKTQDKNSEKKTTTDKAIAKDIAARKLPPMKGVYPATRKDGTPYFRASLTYRQKHISLGGFSTPGKAHQAYQEGCHLLTDHKYTLMQYSPASALPYEKWVCLLNFRDNGIYFGTPIYMGQKMFTYHLSPELNLKFDLDDLFYYASHKIMCRGNHYFVADYGMQLNLAARYGIRNYAVTGRDYCFRNGDPTDFRRENLQIFNPYHGVVEENGQFTARIHVNGYYLIGRYPSAMEAAIAYNKAADLLQKKGIQKKYAQNYIDGLLPSRYADLYTQIKISSAIENYSIFPNNR